MTRFTMGTSSYDRKAGSPVLQPFDENRECNLQQMLEDDTEVNLCFKKGSGKRRNKCFCFLQKVQI